VNDGYTARSPPGLCWTAVSSRPGLARRDGALDSHRAALPITRSDSSRVLNMTAIEATPSPLASIRCYRLSPASCPASSI
jgi:hypothetical protein